MKFVAFERTAQGTGASRRLRNSGKTPAIVYGGKGQPEAVELDHNALWYALKKEAFHSTILEMELGGKTSQVLLRNVQYHPFKPMVLHVDFQRVLADSKLTMKVPLHFTGAEESDAVKLDKCVINHIANDIEITCLPADLPEFISIDLSNLKKGETIHLNDITLPKGVSAVTHGKNNPAVLTASLPTVQEEEKADTPAAAAEPSAEAAKK